MALAATATVLAGCGAATTSSTATHRVKAGVSSLKKRDDTLQTAAARARQARVARETMPGMAHGPAITQLSHKLRVALHPLGVNTGVLVTDLSADKSLYSLRASVARPPASVEKLYATTALLDLMGPNARLETRVVGTGHLGKHGIWHGNLYLIGGGDPTFGDGYWNKVDEDGYGPTAGQLVTELHRRGLRQVTGRIYGDESLFDSDRGGPATHDKPDTPDYDGELSALVYDHGMTMKHLNPAEFAAHELMLTMKLQGIKARAAKHTAVAPKDPVLLAEVASPPMRVMVRLMDVPSDDLFADLFAKQLGARYFGQGTLAGGAIEIRQLLATRYGLRPAIHDGSGLDRADRTTPDQVVSLLRQIWHTPIGRVLYAALPVVGKQGTVAAIGLHTYAASHCVAKTGTLDNVTNLAGYCHTRSGHTVAFTMFVDGPNNWVAITRLSKAVGVIANY